jgi:hypothetical protein
MFDGFHSIRRIKTDYIRKKFNQLIPVMEIYGVFLEARTDILRIN